jgi:hypothetical protein
MSVFTAVFDDVAGWLAAWWPLSAAADGTALTVAAGFLAWQRKARRS